MGAGEPVPQIETQPPLRPSETNDVTMAARLPADACRLAGGLSALFQGMSGRIPRLREMRGLYMHT